MAIVRGEPGQRTEVLASEINSQIALHREHGGVVPELASRNHSLHLRGLVEMALLSGLLLSLVMLLIEPCLNRLLEFIC